MQSTERFLVYPDQYDLMAWRPFQTSELWNHILDDDWWYMFEERPELEELVKLVRRAYDKACKRYREDSLEAALEVTYSLTSPPGLKALPWGTHCGASEFGYIFRATTKTDLGLRELNFATGHIESITMAPIQTGRSQPWPRKKRRFSLKPTKPSLTKPSTTTPTSTR